MKLFFWKDNFMIDSFAKQLADDFFSHIPPTELQRYFASPDTVEAEAPEPAPTKRGKKPAKAKPAKAPSTGLRIHDMALKTAQFKQQSKLGVYGKARLHLTFMERLAELGYEQSLARQLNNLLLRRSA
jgi:hypothetical protein